jgi:AraC-like DNA-binding protein
MHSLQLQRPCSALRALVRVYAQRELGPRDSDIVELIPARLEQTLEFQFGHFFEVRHGDGQSLTAPEIVVIGAHPRSGTTIALKRGVVSFAVFFQPVGFSRLFKIPMTHLSVSSHDARGVLGKWISALHGRLAEISTFAGRVRLIEDVLLKQAEKGLFDTPMTRVATDMFASKGALRIADVAFRHGIGRRHFEREFLRQVGFTPKLYARVARFQTALDQKIMHPHRRWVDIANDLGYHDQMHMIHDFHDLAGDTPGMLLSMLGDARPTALARIDN